MYNLNLNLILPNSRYLNCEELITLQYIPTLRDVLKGNLTDLGVLQALAKSATTGSQNLIYENQTSSNLFERKRIRKLGSESE